MIYFHFRARVHSTKSKVVQTERKTKEKFVFLCFAEVQPTFGIAKGTNK